MIIDPKKEERSYDREYTLLLEGWVTIDGGGPEASKMGRISPGGMMGMNMMGMMRRQPMSGEPLQEPVYVAYGINGKVFNASVPFKVRKGDRVRLRIINASSTTTFTLRIPGHSLTITHTDGRPTVPLEVDALMIGVTERYDVELHANNPGRWHIYNLTDGSPVGGWSLGAVLYEGTESKNYNDDNLKTLRLNDYNLLDGAEESYSKPVGKVDKFFRMTLSGG